MASSPEYDIQVLIASGPENPCRAQLGFQTALAAMASDLNVVVFLSTNAVLWAMKNAGPAQIGCGMKSIREDIHSMIAMLGDGGARIEICSACVGEHCEASPADEEYVPEFVLENVALGGLTTVAIRSAKVNTMTF